MSRLASFVSSGFRSLLVLVPVVLGACTAMIEEPYERHRGYYGPALAGPVVVVPQARYHDRGWDGHGRRHHHDRWHH